MIGVSFSRHNKTDIYKKMLSCVKIFEFEEAIKISKKNNVMPTLADMDQIINSLILQRKSSTGINPSHKLDLGINALKRFRDHGCDPEEIIEKTILPEGYNGKILMIMIVGGVVNRKSCLRSGDMWHREILKNTENEIRDLGFFESSVYELGGAHVRFEANNDIVIFGTSDDFGSCDKVHASKLIKMIFKDRKIIIMD